jgi:DNA (cytosine-5)-methyltransferase 1
MKAISIFSGAGGLDLGCEAAGFDTIAAVEWNEAARATMLKNRAAFFPELNQSCLLPDVVDVVGEELLDRVGTERGQIDLVHGGPPCTPFSKSGYWLEYKRRGADPKASLLDEYVRLLYEIRPKAFLMENVYGLAYRNQNEPVFARFRNAVLSAGYSLSHRVLLAADYGVPQLRQRLLCVGVRADLLDCTPADWVFTWPEPTHGGPHETRKDWNRHLPPHMTAGEALAGLNEAANLSEPEELISGTYAEHLKRVPPGENYLFFTAERGHLKPEFEWRSRYWSFLLKLHPDRPSPTIQGQPGPWVGPFHWESRRLRIAELKRLMSFPDDFVVTGTRREQQLQLGNAVPPSFAEAIALNIATELRRLGVAPEKTIPAAA